MYKNRYNVIFAFFLLFIYDYLFWSQTLGLNVLLFTCLAVPLLVIGNKLSLVYRNTQVTIMGTLLLAVLVFIYNSGTAKVAYVISFFLMVGFIHQEHKVRQGRKIIKVGIAQIFRKTLNPWLAAAPNFRIDFRDIEDVDSDRFL